ncbi:MAG TPA: hypothetical protein VLL27_04755 [Solirubrobacterales bacterium]|nr:hypothetical protein [Solirubrobacterales bacterium]
MTWREDIWSTDGPGGVNSPMVLFGVVVFIAGLAVPGKETVVVSLLIALGVGTAAVGLVINRSKRIEVGPQGFKVSRDGGTVVPQPWLAAEGETLNRIAVRVLGDQDIGREAVEKSLTRIRRHRGDIPKSELNLATFKTLISELHRRDRNMSWPGDSPPVKATDGVPAALRSLSFGVRLAYAFSYEFESRYVAEILDRSEEEIDGEIRSAAAVIAADSAEPEGDGNG